MSFSVLKSADSARNLSESALIHRIVDKEKSKRDNVVRKCETHELVFKMKFQAIKNLKFSQLFAEQKQKLKISETFAVHPPSLWTYRQERTSPDCLKIKRKFIQTIEFSIPVHILLLQ